MRARFNKYAFLIAFAFMALLATALLNKALLRSYTILPLDLIGYIAPWDRQVSVGGLQNPLISDPFYFFYPSRKYVTEVARDGRLPLWNPYIMSGLPTMGNTNDQPFYPPNLLVALVLRAHNALPLLAWFHLIVTGCLMYLFLRQWKLNQYAAVLGGLTWMLNGYAIVWLENPHRLSTAAWMPAIFLAFTLAVQRKNATWAVVAGLFFGLQLLGGQMQFIFYGGLLFGLYLLLWIGSILWERYLAGKLTQYNETGREILRPTAYALILLIFGLGLGAAMLLPANELAAVSQRIRFTPETIVNTRWPLRHLVTLFAPDFYGHPNQYTYWGDGNYAEVTAYFGAVNLLLALTALFVARRSTLFWFSLSAAVIILPLTLGASLAGYLFFLPGAKFIVLVRMIYLLPFIGAILAAVALDGWTTRSGRRHTAAFIFAALVIAAVVVWTLRLPGQDIVAHQAVISASLMRSALLVAAAATLLWLARRWPQPALIALLLLAAFDLLQWGMPFNPITPVAYLYPDNEVAAYLREDDSLHRVLPLQSERVVFGPNVPSVFGFQEPGGYSSLILNQYRQLYKTIDDRVEISWMRPNLNMLIWSHYRPEMSLLNVKYLLAVHPLPEESVTLRTPVGCEQKIKWPDYERPFSFTVAEPGLHRVDLHFWVAETAVTKIKFQLWQEDKLITQSERTVEAASGVITHTLLFEPIIESAGQAFVWQVEAPDHLSLCASADNEPSLALYAAWLAKRAELQGVWIYENLLVLPRAYLVSHARHAPDDEALQLLRDPDFNWRQSAAVADPLPSDQSAQLTNEPRPVVGQAVVTDYQHHAVHLTVASETAAFLVLSDAYYPGWVATINGQETPIYRTNHALRGLFIPAGSHEVVFSFRPRSVTIGLSLTLLTLLAAAVVAGICHISRSQVR